MWSILYKQKQLPQLPRESRTRILKDPLFPPHHHLDRFYGLINSCCVLVPVPVTFNVKLSSHFWVLSNESIMLSKRVL